MPKAPDNHDAYDYAERIRRKSITCISSPFTKPNPPSVLALLPRVFSLCLLRLLDFPLQQLLRHQPHRRISIHTPRIDCIDAYIQNVPTAESLR